MPLPDLLPIPPFTRPVAGEVIVPGSKSLTNRALLLAALCDRPVTLTEALFSEDTEIMVEALRRLGFSVRPDADAGTVAVEGADGRIPAADAELFVGLAGTAARFLTALCAAASRGRYVLRGVPQMHRRPMKGLIDALRSQGAEIRCLENEGFFPIEIHARGLRGGRVQIDARESSQMLSALLMVAPLAAAPLEIEPVGGVRLPFVEMTGRLMADFTGIGASTWDQGAYRVPVLTPQLRYRSPGRYAIEPDATAASYFLALPLVTGGSLLLRGLKPRKAGLQGDSEFMAVLETVGARIEPLVGDSGGRAAEGIRVTALNRGGAGVARDFSAHSDTFLTLAAIAPLLTGPTRISGIAHTRKQETDRVAGMARELTRLGQRVIETDDALEIHPQPLRTGEIIETYGDHRFAMSFGILGSHDLHGDGRPWLTVRNPACCAKTFPQFFELLDAVRKKSLGS